MAWTDYYTDEEIANFLGLFDFNPLDLLVPRAEAANVARSGPFANDIVGAGSTGKGGGGSGSGYINQIFKTPNIANNPILKPSSAVINKPNIFTQPKAVMKQTFPKPTTSSTRVQPQISPAIRNVKPTYQQSPRIEQPAGREPFSLSDLNAQVSGNVIKRRTPMSSMGINRDPGNTRLANFLRSPSKVIGAASTVGPLGYMGARSLFEDNEQISPVKTQDSAVKGIMSKAEIDARNKAIANAPDQATKDAIISGKVDPKNVTSKQANLFDTQGPFSEEYADKQFSLLDKEYANRGMASGTKEKSFIDRIKETNPQAWYDLAYQLQYAGTPPKYRQNMKTPAELRMQRAKSAEASAQQKFANSLAMARYGLDLTKYQDKASRDKAIGNISTFTKAFEDTLADFKTAGYIPFDDYSDTEMEAIKLKAFQYHNKYPDVDISDILKLIEKEKELKIV